MKVATGLRTSGLNIQYNFSSTNNNGKIASETDVVSGETVTYTYDSLNRLASATSSTPAWGQSFGYDGFGNLTTVGVTKGTALSLSVSYSAATNRRTTDTADANGNILQSGVTNYDVENRIAIANISGGTARYSYAPGNKRVWRGTWSGSTQTVDKLTYYSASGAKLCSYNLTTSGSDLRAASTGYYEYFGGKLIKNAGGYVGQDRLGCIGKFFPYGQERPSATSNGKEKFSTYFRDSETGLDCAQNRYHSFGDGRFLSPDPYQASAGPSDPGSWNRYSYASNDPINGNDPSGLQTYTGIPCDPNEFNCYNVTPGPGPYHGYCDPSTVYNPPDCVQCPGIFKNGQCYPPGYDPDVRPHCGINPVSGEPGINERASGTPGELRPGRGGRGEFGSPRSNRYGSHMGIDIAGKVGSSVMSVTAGVVIAVGTERNRSGEVTGWGNYVIVSANGYEFVYAHLQSQSVKVGQALSMGMEVGTLGQTGNARRDPPTEGHVHFEVRKDSVHLDPAEFLNNYCPW